METSILNTLQYNCETLHTAHATSIAEDKRRRIIWVIYSPETYIIWKEFLRLSKIYQISKNVDSAARIRFWTNVESYCALQIERNAYKLKRWLTIQNSSNSSYDSLPSKNWSESDVKSEKTDSGNFSIQFKDQKHDIFRNIEAWRKNIMIKKSDQSEDEQVIGEEKKDLPPKFPSTDKANTSVSQTSNFENSITHVPAKEINSEYAQTFPLSCIPTTRNEFNESFKCITSTQYSTYRGLFCRPTVEDGCRLLLSLT